MGADDEAARLRLVSLLKERNPDMSSATERGFSVVKRHRFVPRYLDSEGFRPVDHQGRRTPGTGGSVECFEEIYSDTALLTHAAADGAPLSSSTMPTLMTTMLDALQLMPGLAVLEIGAGTGYNAAIMAEILDHEGQVVTVESRPEVAAEARVHLASAGYGNVLVVTGDGFDGYSAGAPYDRIVATVGCGDISPRWLNQLEENGTILVPLDHGGLHPLVQVKRDGSMACEGGFAGWSKFIQAEGSLAGRRGGITHCTLPPDASWSETSWEGFDPARFLDFWFFCALTTNSAAFTTVRDSSGRQQARGFALAPPDGGAILVRSTKLEGFGEPELWEVPAKAMAAWQAHEAPSLRDFRVRMTLKGRSTTKGVATGDGPTDARGTWVVERAHFKEVVQLT